MALEDLDLVAVRVLDEKEAGHERAVPLELLDRVGAVAERGEAPVFPVQIVHADGQMAVAVAMGVGFGAPVVDGQFDLEIVFVVAQIDQGEAVEGVAVGAFQAERAGVEIPRPLFVEDPDHHVDGLGHGGWLRSGEWLQPEC